MIEPVRCSWALGDPEYLRYHDEEWGVPIRDDKALFERLSLEGFQAGLSWLTVLRKRPAFRAHFADFDPANVAGFGDRQISAMLADPAVIRHRGKIEAVINNARRLLEQWDAHGPNWLTAQFQAATPSLQSFALQGFPRPPRQGQDLPGAVAESHELSRGLKRLGFRFVGPTTLYAAMQATGFVDDHFESCFRAGKAGFHHSV